MKQHQFLRNFSSPQWNEVTLANYDNKPCILPQALCTQEQNNFQKTPILHIEQIALGKKF
jgi:hypothetical protein